MLAPVSWGCVCSLLCKLLLGRAGCAAVSVLSPGPHLFSLTPMRTVEFHHTLSLRRQGDLFISSVACWFLCSREPMRIFHKRIWEVAFSANVFSYCTPPQFNFPPDATFLLFANSSERWCCHRPNLWYVSQISKHFMKEMSSSFPVVQLGTE